MAGLIITGGRIIDPASGMDTVGDLLIQDGRIAQVGNHNGGASGDSGGAGVSKTLPTTVEANGCIVTPGLIDCHVHAYEHVTPLGLNLDERCLSRGVTTAVDAGSAGCSTLPGLRKFIAEGSACRLYAFLHIAAHGLASAGCAGLLNGGECDSLNQLNVEQCVETITNNPDLVVGVKVRITASVADDGRNEQESYRRALQAAQNAAVPLMVHHSFSTIPKVKTEGFLSCPGDMIKGDIHTHTYHNHPGGIVDSSGRVIQDVLDARKRGVLFDVGHGAGSFSWDSLEACAREGFWPDLISTDLHVESMNGPAYDLTSVMTKLLHAGMPLVDVISAVTSKPAAAIGKSNIIGSLKVGMEADVTILRIEECSIELEDTVGQTRKVTKRIVPVRVFRAGKEYPIREYCEYPNLKSKAECLNRAKEYAKLAPTFVRK